jgi:hypothetical protein
VIQERTIKVPVVVGAPVIGKCWIWYLKSPVVPGGTWTTTEPVPVSMSVGLAGLGPRNCISIVGNVCERFENTRMPPGRTPEVLGVSSGSATIVLGAIAETAGVVMVPISCLALWGKVSGWNEPDTMPGPKCNMACFSSQHRCGPCAAQHLQPAIYKLSKRNI